MFVLSLVYLPKRYEYVATVFSYLTLQASINIHIYLRLPLLYSSPGPPHTHLGINIFFSALHLSTCFFLTFPLFSYFLHSRSLSALDIPPFLPYSAVFLLIRTLPCSYFNIVLYFVCPLIPLSPPSVLPALFIHPSTA